MADERPTHDDHEGQSLASFMALGLGILLLVLLASAAFGSVSSKAISLDKFRKHLEKNEIEEVVFRDNSCEILFRPGDLSGELGTRKRRMNFINEENAAKYEELIRLQKAEKPEITTRVRVLPASGDSSTLVWALMVVLFFVAFYFLFIRPLRAGPGGGLLNFGKSRARVVGRDQQVKLDDVAGVDEAKAEVQEIIQYLKDPDKFRDIGARIPKGVLLVGPPGTGKTLLAKATAGEAGVQFFTSSGSDFVEMFAGVGASRARDMFKTARDNAPCILFLDEIDAVGRQRGPNVSGGHEERDQTLNQILVEMDGFETDTAVIVMAATNRPDILDSALLRPGRFDRKIVLSLPDVKGREAILKVHSSKVKIHEDVDLRVIARATPGFSGAELEAVINEAALAAALKGRPSILHDDLEEARDKVRWGRQRHSRAMDPDDLKATAWHEAGHALVSVKIKECDPLHKVTIIPRGMALGATMSLPEKDVTGLNRRQILAKIAQCYGGRIGEELVTDDWSTGASNDYEQATDLARRMVCEWGMAPDLGPVSFSQRSEETAFHRKHSEETARKIDEQIRDILERQYERARLLIQGSKDALERVADGLLLHETLTGDEVEKLIDGTDPKALRVKKTTSPSDDSGEEAESQATKDPATDSETPETESEARSETDSEAHTESAATPSEEAG